jgi:hypothetical protein
MSALAETATATRRTCECRRISGGRGGRRLAVTLAVARASQGGLRWCTGGGAVVWWSVAGCAGAGGWQSLPDGGGGGGYGVVSVVSCLVSSGVV